MQTYQIKCKIIYNRRQTTSEQNITVAAAATAAVPQPAWPAPPRTGQGSAAGAAAATVVFYSQLCSPYAIYQPYVIYLFIFDLFCSCISHSIIMFEYLQVKSFKYGIGTTVLMSKCFGHKASFADTHRHFRPAIKISRICPCGGLELKKSNLKNKCLYSQYLFCYFQQNMYLYSQ